MWYVVCYSNGKACTNQDRPRGDLFDSTDESCDKEFYWTTSASGSSGDGYRHINTCFETDGPALAPTSCK